MKLEEINDKMLVFCSNRLQTLGSEKGGLLHYYEQRVENKIILKAERERYLIEYIQNNYPLTTTIHEFACGAAQLGHSLSLLGYEVSASEIMKARFNFATELGLYLNSKCIIIYGDFTKIQTSAKLYITINAVSGDLDLTKNLHLLKEKLNQGSDIIFHAGLYGKQYDCREL